MDQPSSRKRHPLKDYAELFAFTKPHKKVFLLAVGAMIISTIFDGVTMGMVVPFSDKILSNSKIILPANLPDWMERLIAVINAMPQLQMLYVMAGMVVVLFLLKGIFTFLQGSLMSEVGQRVMRDIRSRLYSKFQEMDLEYFSRKRSGELISRITNDVAVVENAVSYGFTDLIYQSLQILMFSVVVIALYWRLALVAVVMVPFISIPIVVVGRRLRKISRATQEKMADINTMLFETISGVRIVRAFGAQPQEIDRFNRNNKDYYKLSMKSINRTLMLGPLTEYIGAIGGVVIMIYFGRMVVEQKISAGAFGLFMGSIMMMIRPFKKLSNVNSIMQKAFAANTRIYEVLNLQPKIKDDPQSWVLPGIKHGLELRDVWFRYESADILKGINLRCGQGEVVAIVGPSGAGKSTLLDLVLRFYDPQKGAILIDGRDIRTLNLASLRQHIGMVSQETFLFHGTVRENIAYGKPGANYDEIVDAAQKAFAHEFILNLSQGYDTVIGDRGVKLSGGERQRLAIARAVLKNPPLLILDEATSQLDTQSERYVQDALDRLMKGRTVLVVAHRLSTIKHATRIVVLREGQAVEEGRHEELLKNSGLYRRLYEMQFSLRED